MFISSFRQSENDLFGINLIVLQEHRKKELHWENTNTREILCIFYPFIIFTMFIAQKLLITARLYSVCTRLYYVPPECNVKQVFN